jgi:DNA-binding MarR family transcriptional regulator
MAKIAAEVGYQSLPLLDYLARLGRQAFERSPGGLRPRHLIALKLLEEHGPLSQQIFGERLSLDPSNVVGLLNELEERGLVSRRRDPADRRRHIVELSAAGNQELAAANVRLSALEDELLGALSSDERLTLYQLLVRAVGSEPSPCAVDDEAPSAC